VCLNADAARFDCENSKVTVGERNVFLKCEVRARPRLTALFWVIDDNNTRVSEGVVVDPYWMLTYVCYLHLHELLHMQALEARSQPNIWGRSFGRYCGPGEFVMIFLKHAFHAV